MSASADRNFRGTALSDRGTKRGRARVQQGALVVGLLILLAGCRDRDKVHESNDRVAHGGYHNTPASVPGKMAAVGNDSITTECEHESYTNASKGLIVGNAGLHEDVFALRDRASLATNAYSLNEALLLEDLLRAEAKVASHSAEQANCIDEFAEHFATLTDTLVQADKVQRELHLSAFNEATRQADDLLEKQSRSEPAAKTPR
jgi:hypothetical protein